MPKYTVQCGYNAAYGNTAVVDATDPAAACEAAIAAVNDCSAWRAHDDVGPTYVDAIAEGDDVDPWVNGARSALPIPGRFTERAVTVTYALIRADDMRRILSEFVSLVAHRESVCATSDQIITMRTDIAELLDDIAREGAHGRSPVEA